MSQPGNTSRDSLADAVATTVIIAIVVGAISLWLANMPA
jgi:hypothetical protein